METRTVVRPLAENPKFASPEQEIAYLRERVRSQQEHMGLPNTQVERDRIAKREIEDYADVPSARILHEVYTMPEHETVRAILKLEPETHDKQMDSLLDIIAERGIKNGLAVVSRMNNPHLEDDFHRILVRYVAEGLPAKGSLPSERINKALQLALYKIEPQAHAENTEKQTLEEALKSSEQLYAGLLSLVGENESFSLEIATPQGSEEAILYFAVPKARGTLAERLVHSVFPSARIEESRGDYNIFSDGGVHVGATATLGSHGAFAIKTYESFQHDPLNVVLAAFAKIAKHGEGAALQIVVGSEGERYNKYYQKILREVEKGESVKKALKTPETRMGEFVQDVSRAVFSQKKDEKESAKPKTPDESAREGIGRKVKTRIVPVSIRVVASASDEKRASELLENLAAPFGQFDDPKSNRIVFKQANGRALNSLLHAFTFRLLEPESSVPLNMTELTSLFHFTAERVTTSRELKKAQGKQAPAPIEMPQDGIVLGLNRYGGSETEVRFGAQDRLRHCYVIGQTGTGKTNLIKNMAIQDIQRGEGVAFIDPHGSDIDDVLAAVPPEREKDIIYFDPAYAERPMGLNMLEYDPAKPEMKTLIVDELYGIFRKLYADVPEAFGPMFEQYYRNATMLVLDDPSSGGTLMEIPRVFANEKFRALKLSRCKNPIVVQFWRDIAEKTGGEHALENMVPWITSKMDVFLSNDIMRPVVAQEKSAFNFRDIMDNKKIFLANLSKGRLGERNMSLLGLVLVSKFAQAAFSRADKDGTMPPFYLYIDEFQNFTTPSISSILSEARKYKLSLTIAHQFIAQLDEKIRDAVVGNVGTKIAFRVGTTDAEFLVKQFEPVFTASDLTGLENYNAAAALLVNGTPVRPLSLATVQAPAADHGKIDRLKELSYRTFGRDRSEVEEEIRRKFV